jgi:cysteine-rich secretory family protein
MAIPPSLRLLVAGALALSSLGLGPSVATAQEAPAAAPASAGDPRAEARLLQLLNQARASANLPALTFDGALAARAREHALGMANAGKLFHRALSELPQNCSASRAENVGRAASPDVVHELFMQDPSHRAEVLGPFNKVGIGIAVVGPFVYVTQDFCVAGSAAAPAPPAPRPKPKPVVPPKPKVPAPPPAPAPAAQARPVVLQAASVTPQPTAGMGSPCRLL